MINNFESNSNKFYNILKYIHLFLLSNIYFGICNFLLILTLIFFELDFYNILIFLIPIIFLAPSLSALFYLFNKFINLDKDLMITREFFKGYKNNFFSSLKIWIPLLISIIIIILDIKISILNINLVILTIPLTLLFIFNILIMLYSIILNSKYEISFINNLKLSLYILIKKPLISLLNLLIMAFCILILLYSNSLISLFIVGLSAYLILNNLNKSFLAIEKSYINNRKEIGVTH